MPRATILGRDYALVPFDITEGKNRKNVDGITNCKGEAFGYLAVDVETAKILNRGIWLFPDCPGKGHDSWVMFTAIDLQAIGQLSVSTASSRLAAAQSTANANAPNVARLEQLKSKAHASDPYRNPLPYSPDPSTPLMVNPLWTAPLQLVTQAEEDNKPDASFILASRLVRSRNESEYNRGVSLLQIAANKGDRRAATLLGLANTRVVGYGHNYQIARESFDKAIALGDPVAMVHLGSLYREGTSVPKDLGKAISLWKQAASLGDPDAKRWLGWAYLTGSGVPRNETTACRQYLAEAAKYEIDRARYLFAQCLRSGTGVTKDLSLAFSLAYSARNPEVFDRDREYLLGQIQYEVARSGGITDVDALGFLQRAAKLHNVDAMFLLAKLRLDRRLQGTFDLADGTHWLEEAARQGHPQALKLLGKDQLLDAIQREGLDN